MFEGRGGVLGGGEVVAITPDTTLHYLRCKTRKGVHPLRGLGADHVFNGRKRTEALLKQVMLSAAKQIGIGVGCLN